MATVDDLLGRDPVKGNRALQALIQEGQASLDAISKQFSEIGGSPQHRRRLSRLFGHFPDQGITLLIKALSSGDYSHMRSATFCFDELPAELAQDSIGALLDQHDIDVRRCAIDSLGGLGAHGWGYKILELVNASSYNREKLSYNALEAFLRMAGRAQFPDDAISNLRRVERLAIERDDRVLNMMREWSTRYWVFKALTPVAADALLLDWLPHKHSVFRESAAVALGLMRLKRAVTSLARTLTNSLEEESVRLACAEALGTIGGSEATVRLWETWDELNLSQEQGRSDAPLHERVQYHLARVVMFDLDRDRAKATAIKLSQASGDETRANAVYALGLLGGSADLLHAPLESTSYIERSAAALGYARRMGNAALPRLRHMEREASGQIERVLVLAALVHAGAEEKVPDLHAAMCQMDPARDPGFLRHEWQREILLAFDKPDDENHERATAWGELWKLSVDQCYEELTGLIPPRTSNTATRKDVHSLSIVDSQTSPKQEVDISAAGAAYPPANRKSLKRKIEIFYSYSHKDEKMRNQLENHLKLLERDGLIRSWYDRKIDPGDDWRGAIDDHLRTADIILLLISSDFIASDYCSDVEIKFALERHQLGEARVIPVLLRNCNWKIAPFTQPGLDLQAIPRDGRPVDHRWWKNQHEAFAEIAREITRIVEKLVNRSTDVS